jgi:hypothetical protein
MVWQERQPTRAGSGVAGGLGGALLSEVVNRCLAFDDSP